MKNWRSKIITAVLFAAGLSLLLYPLVSNRWNDRRQKKLITEYEDAVREAGAAIDYGEELKRAETYNEELSPKILPDSFAVASNLVSEDREYLSCLNLAGDGMMGILEIPEIAVKLPVYHTTSEEVLQAAAGHLEGSSLPVGGAGTHAVISAHRGLPSAALFTDLNLLEEGDYFLLDILEEKLCYRVDLISVVEPDDTQALAAVPGEDHVTLMTCTPYGVNSHRLLVRGSRVPYEEGLVEEVPAAGGILGKSLHTNYLLWVIAGLAVTGLFVLVMFYRERKMYGGSAGVERGRAKTGRPERRGRKSRGPGSARAEKESVEKP